MKTLQLPGQFIYEAFVIPPRKRTEHRMWLHGTTVYDIACVTRDDDAIGELRFTIGTREDMSPEDLSRLRHVKLAEYGGRLWRKGSYEPTGVAEYAHLLGNWVTRKDGPTQVESIMMDPVVVDPILNSVVPRQRERWPAWRSDRPSSDTSHIGRIMRSDRKTCEARYQTAAADVLFIDGVLHYPAAAPVWQCYVEDGAPTIELEELAFTESKRQHAPERPVGEGLLWSTAFALDRLQDAFALHAADLPDHQPSIRGTIDAVPTGYEPVPPLAYCISKAMDAEMLDPLAKLTHLLSVESVAAWKRLIDLECERRRYSLGRLAQDPMAAAEDIRTICREVDEHFLSEAEEDAFEPFYRHAYGIVRRLEFEKSRVSALLDDEALAKLA